MLLMLSFGLLLLLLLFVLDYNLVNIPRQQVLLENKKISHFYGLRIQWLHLDVFFCFCCIHVWNGILWMCSCHALKWILAPQRKLPVTAVRTPEDNCRRWRWIQRRWERPECLGPALRRWRFQWPKGKASAMRSLRSKRLMVTRCRCSIVSVWVCVK